MVVIEEYLKQRGVNRWGVRGRVVEQILTRDTIRKVVGGKKYQDQSTEGIIK